jgi:DNA-binding NarL/FixJ family response regulator
VSRAFGYSVSKGTRRAISKVDPSLILERQHTRQSKPHLFVNAHKNAQQNRGSIGFVNSPTIIVAEDHPMFRAALVLTLKRLMPEALLLEVASHGELEKALAGNREAGLVLLDLRMPGARGLSSLVFLRGEYPHVSVAVISGGAYAETIDRARQLGASAFIPKSAPIDTIAQALSTVIRGESWFPEQAEVSTPRGLPLQEQLPTLTAQQFRVLKFLADGMLNKQIAETLEISEGTVRAHVTAILRKLGVSTRTQAVILVTELDLEKDGEDSL